MPFKGVLLILVVAIIWAVIFRDELLRWFHIDLDEKLEDEDDVLDAIINDFKEDDF